MKGQTMTHVEMAELVGFYFGLQAAGNMRPNTYTPEAANTLNALREMIDLKMRQIQARLPPDTIDNWPQEMTRAEAAEQALKSFELERDAVRHCSSLDNPEYQRLMRLSLEAEHIAKHFVNAKGG
jgi:hypothetical protein